MRMFAGQVMAAYDRQDITVVFYPDSIVFRPLVESSVPLRSSERKFGGTISFFSRGAFDPKAILDDYLGYYKGLLFDGQQRIVVGVEYAARPDAEPFGYDVGTVQLNGARGLGGGFEASAAVQYNWEKTRLLFEAGLNGRERIRWEFGIRWRSFEYQPDVGPGWGRDSNADIAFGPMLKPGDLYVGITCAPPGLRTRSSVDGGGFLSFNSLVGVGTLGLRFDAEAGLGYNINILGDARILFGDEIGCFTDEELELQVGLRKRLGTAVEIRTAYEQDYQSGYHDPAQITLSLAGLF